MRIGKGCPSTKKGSLLNRLLRRSVKKDSGCVEWQGFRTKKGYGQIGLGKKEDGITSTHRAMYIAIHGSIPQGMIVRHKCDNPACVNPDHLELGTCKDNSMDMVKRGRTNGPKGCRNFSNKLQVAEVLLIRKLYKDGISLRTLAKQYSVNKNTVQDIVNHNKWKWLKEELE
jgi:hypothetical protein